MIRMIRKTVISSLATPHSRRASSHLSPVKSNDSEHQPLSSKKEQRQVYSPTTKGYRQWGQDHSRRRFLRQHQLRLVFHSISSETQYFATPLSVSRSITIKSHSWEHHEYEISCIKNTWAHGTGINRYVPEMFWAYSTGLGLGREKCNYLTAIVLIEHYGKANVLI